MKSGGSFVLLASCPGVLVYANTAMPSYHIALNCIRPQLEPEGASLRTCAISSDWRCRRGLHIVRDKCSLDRSLNSRLLELSDKVNNSR
jgi:hypothetical protein